MNRTECKAMRGTWENGTCLVERDVSSSVSDTYVASLHEELTCKASFAEKGGGVRAYSDRLGSCYEFEVVEREDGKRTVRELYRQCKGYDAFKEVGEKVCGDAKGWKEERGRWIEPVVRLQDEKGCDARRLRKECGLRTDEASCRAALCSWNGEERAVMEGVDGTGKKECDQSEGRWKDGACLVPSCTPLWAPHTPAEFRMARDTPLLNG